MSSPETSEVAQNRKRQLNNLASSSNGAKILFATDDFFAVAENLLKDSEPLFDPTTFTEFGKEMDGWETRRKRVPGHDWCIIKLGGPCKIEQILANTAHFTGNHVPKISIQAANLPEKFEKDLPKRISQLGGTSTPWDMEKFASKTKEWKEIVKMTQLQAGYEATRHTYISVESPETFNYLRLNYYPDGGLARLKVFGVVRVNLSKNLVAPIDLLSVLSGTLCYGFSNAHYGHPSNLIKPLKGTSMADGWETARRLDRPSVLEMGKNGQINYSGSEYALFKLGVEGKVDKIVIDTSYFKGNPPAYIDVLGANTAHQELISNWTTIVSSYTLTPHSEHIIEGKEIKASGPFTYIKVVIVPDGGISRIRVFGFPIND